MSQKIKVVLAEDDFLVLMGLKSTIEELGHVVVGEAMDGEKAVTLAKQVKPDLIIMDINMPKLDGISAIKEINKTMVVPCIIVSAYYDENFINSATDEGVLYYLIKPINTKELEIAIKISLSKFKEIKALQKDLESTQQALKARKYIERAKGVLMDRKKLKEQEAMRQLQKMSRDRNKKLVDIAKEIIQADSIFNS